MRPEEIKNRDRRKASETDEAVHGRAGAMGLALMLAPVPGMLRPVTAWASPGLPILRTNGRR